MKILFVVDNFPPEKTVVGRLVWETALELKDRGLEVVILTTANDLPKLPFRLKVGEFSGLRVYSLPRLARSEFWRFHLTLWNPLVNREFKKVLALEKPDIVHAHNIHQFFSFSILMVAKNFGAKVFLTAHDVATFHYGKLVEFINPRELSIPRQFNYHVSAWSQIKRFKKWYNPFRRLIIRHYLRHANKIFTVSEALAEVLKQNGITNTLTIHNALDLGAWSTAVTEPEAFRKKFGLRDKKIIFFGGRLSGAKGGAQLIASLPLILAQIPDAVLMIVGSPNNYLTKLLHANQDFQSGGQLIATGWLAGQELRSAFAASEVVVFPSICFDTFGMVNLEAMASEKPVVATCFGGSPEIVQDGVTGYIVNPFNIIQLAQLVTGLLADHQKAESFGRAGFKRASDFFTLEQAVSKLITAYRVL